MNCKKRLCTVFNLFLAGTAIAIVTALSCPTSRTIKYTHYNGFTSNGDSIVTSISSSSYSMNNSTTSYFINGSFLKNSSDDLKGIMTLYKDENNYYGYERLNKYFTSNIPISDATTQLNISLSSVPVNPADVPGDYIWLSITDATTSYRDWGIMTIDQTNFYRRDFYMGNGGSGELMQPDSLTVLHWNNLVPASNKGEWSVDTDKEYQLDFNGVSGFIYSNDVIIIKNDTDYGFLLLMRLQQENITQTQISGDYRYVNMWRDVTGDVTDYGAGNFAISDSAAAFYHVSHDLSNDPYVGSLTSFSAINNCDGTVKWTAERSAEWTGTLFMIVSPQKNCMYILLINDRVRSMGIGGLLD